MRARKTCSGWRVLETVTPAAKPSLANPAPTADRVGDVAASRRLRQHHELGIQAGYDHGSLPGPAPNFACPDEVIGILISSP
jgi:hypothetical protein